jgi:hypothetical protein
VKKIPGLTDQEMKEFLQWVEQRPIEEFAANCLDGDFERLRPGDTQRYLVRMLDMWLQEKESDQA